MFPIVLFYAVIKNRNFIYNKVSDIIGSGPFRASTETHRSYILNGMNGLGTNGLENKHININFCFSIRIL